MNVAVITCIVDPHETVTPQTPLFTTGTYEELDTRKLLKVSTTFSTGSNFVGVALTAADTYTRTLAVAIGGVVNMRVDKSWTSLDKHRAPARVLVITRPTESSEQIKFEAFGQGRGESRIAGLLLDFDIVDTTPVVRLLLLPGVDEVHRATTPAAPKGIPVDGAAGRPAPTNSFTIKQLIDWLVQVAPDTANNWRTLKLQGAIGDDEPMQRLLTKPQSGTEATPEVAKANYLHRQTPKLTEETELLCREKGNDTWADALETYRNSW